MAKPGDTRTVKCPKCKGSGISSKIGYSRGEGFKTMESGVCLCCNGIGTVEQVFMNDGGGGNWYTT